MKTVNKYHRTTIAERTLEIIRRGHYEINGKTIDVSEQIALSVAATETLSPEMTDDMIAIWKVNTGKRNTQISVERASTIEAIMNYSGKAKTLVLNFASAKNPGGGFLGGASAQEESLARSSSLYPSLTKDDTMYKYNRGQRSFIYSDYMIYSPSVLFWMDDDGNLLSNPVTADVITIPAPNKGAMLQHNRQDELKQIEEVFHRRIEKLLAVAESRGIEQLILGAWGCGVFRNDPQAVAEFFEKALNGKYSGVFTQIIFAIFDSGKGTTLESFNKVFSKSELCN